MTSYIPTAAFLPSLTISSKRILSSVSPLSLSACTASGCGNGRSASCMRSGASRCLTRSRGGCSGRWMHAGEEGGGWFGWSVDQDPGATAAAGGCEPVGRGGQAQVGGGRSRPLLPLYCFLSCQMGAYMHAPLPPPHHNTVFVQPDSAPVPPPPVVLPLLSNACPARWEPTCTPPTPSWVSSGT